MKKFWFVWNEQRTTPSYKHWSYADALMEAKRLARNQPGEQFHVLVSVCTAEIQEPITVTPHEEEALF